jgi:outer membrane protein TolC
MLKLNVGIDVINPVTGPLKKELDAKIAVAQAAQVDVGAQVSLEVAQHLNQAQIHRLQIERDGTKLRAIDEALADVQSRIGAGVASAADKVLLIEEKDKLNLSLSQNQQSLERELNTLTQLTGRAVSADSLPALKPSPGADFISRQPALPPFDSRTSGVDAETLIQLFANRQNTQLARLEKEIDAAEAALKVAQSQLKPKVSIGFSFPFVPPIRISGGNTQEVRVQIADAQATLEKARLTLDDFKQRNATEIRGAAARARADDPNANDSSWQQRVANADDLLFGSTGANGARSGGLLAAYQQSVAAYQAGTAAKADVLKPYLLLVDALHNRASSSLNLINDVATLRYAIGELDSAQEQATLFKQLDGLLDPQARGTASVPVPVFGEMR